MSTPGILTTPVQRLYYLDWLRVLAVLGIFLFHNARFYDVFSDWHVKNVTTSPGASILVGFMSAWIMPLFFLIAGAGTYLALKVRQAGKFIQERTLRLLIPLIFGMLVVVAPQAYFEALYHGEQLREYNFFQIYWLYLRTLPELNWFHLWFLAYLFAFSVITLPLFVNQGITNKSVISRLAMVFDSPWALLVLLVLSVGAVDAFLYPSGFWGNRNSAGGWNIVTYVLFFISGYLIFANGRIMETIRKLAWVILGVAIAVGACLLIFFLNVLVDLEANFGSPVYITSQFLQALNTWAWLLAILGLGSRYLNTSNKLLPPTNEAVLPFYILHQTVIIVIGFYVVQWNASVSLKYLTISTTSFIAIILIYELLVRRISILRFFFGMRLSRPVSKGEVQ